MTDFILICVLFCLCAGFVAVLIFLRELLMEVKTIRERTRDE